MAKNRHVRNYISDSSLQLRFAGLGIGLFLALSGGVIGYSYYYMEKIMGQIFQIEDIPDGAESIFFSMIGNYFAGLSMLLLSLGSLLAAAIVVQTHKVAGAKFAILRHLREEMQNFRFDRSIKLRETDFLHDIALEINKLGEMIRSKGVLLPIREREAAGGGDTDADADRVIDQAG
jgi:hypothetical protein